MILFTFYSFANLNSNVFYRNSVWWSNTELCIILKRRKDDLFTKSLKALPGMCIQQRCLIRSGVRETDRRSGHWTQLTNYQDISEEKRGKEYGGDAILHEYATTLSLHWLDLLVYLLPWYEESFPLQIKSICSWTFNKTFKIFNHTILVRPLSCKPTFFESLNFNMKIGQCERQLRISTFHMQIVTYFWVRLAFSLWHPFYEHVHNICHWKAEIIVISIMNVNQGYSHKGTHSKRLQAHRIKPQQPTTRAV